MKVLDKSYESMLKILGEHCKVTRCDRLYTAKGIFVKHPYKEIIYFLSNSEKFSGSYPNKIKDISYKYGWFCIRKEDNYSDLAFRNYFEIDIETGKIDYGEL